MEEMLETKKRDRCFENKRNVHGKEKVNVADLYKTSKTFEKEYPPRKSKYNFDTPLTKSKESILEEICHINLLPLLDSARSKDDADKNK